MYFYENLASGIGGVSGSCGLAKFPSCVWMGDICGYIQAFISGQNMRALETKAAKIKRQRATVF